MTTRDAVFPAGRNELFIKHSYSAAIRKRPPTSPSLSF